MWNTKCPRLLDFTEIDNLSKSNFVTQFAIVWTKIQNVCRWSALWLYSSTPPGKRALLYCSRPPHFLNPPPFSKDEWRLNIQRGLCVLAARDIPTAWLPMCANPGKLLASLASPPLVRSWWMAVVFITPPVVTTGTARSRVLLLVPVEVRTGPCGLPQIAFG